MVVSFIPSHVSYLPNNLTINDYDRGEKGLRLWSGSLHIGCLVGTVIDVLPSNYIGSLTGYYNRQLYIYFRLYTGQDN